MNVWRFFLSESCQKVIAWVANSENVILGGSKNKGTKCPYFYLNTTGVGGGRTCSVTRTNSWGMMMGGVTTNLSVTEASAQAALVTKIRVNAIKLFIWVVLIEIFYLNYRARQNLPRSWAANCSLLSPVG